VTCYEAVQHHALCDQHMKQTVLMHSLFFSQQIFTFSLLQALEGLGESQVAESQDLALSRTELSDSTVLFDNKEKRFLGSDGGSIEDLNAAENLSLQDEEWISPPEYTFTSSLGSSMSSIDESLSETSDKAEKLQHSIDQGDGDKCVLFTNTDGPENAYIVKSESEFAKDVDPIYSSAASVPSDPSGTMQDLFLPHKHVLVHSGQLGNMETEKPEKAMLLSATNDVNSSKVIKGHGCSREEPSSFLHPVSRNTRGKKSPHHTLLLYNHNVIFIVSCLF